MSPLIKKFIYRHLSVKRQTCLTTDNCHSVYKYGVYLLLIVWLGVSVFVSCPFLAVWHNGVLLLRANVHEYKHSRKNAWVSKEFTRKFFLYFMKHIVYVCVNFSSLWLQQVRNKKLILEDNEHNVYIYYCFMICLCSLLYYKYFF